MAIQWATQSNTCQPAEWARRLRQVRVFARYRKATDPRTEVPALKLLPYRPQRATPYIYTDKEVNSLLQAAGQLEPSMGISRYTYTTLFGLLAVTGMRIGELIALDNKHVELCSGQLTICDAKFGKSRWLPLHPTTLKALQYYVQRRECQFPTPCSTSFLVCEQGSRLSYHMVRNKFLQFSYQIGLRKPTDSRGPRLHDFRHRFAVNTLLRWYQEDIDVERHLPELSTYLGHVRVSDTYWYLSATPELLQLAMQRAEQGLKGEYYER